MIRVYNETVIKTTPERCFDLSRSIDFHQASMNGTNEVAVGGRRTGLIALGEFVEWEATHLLLRQRLSSKIVEMVRPRYFVDEMIDGPFKSFRHRHEVLVRKKGEVIMIDDFRYEAPLGVIGRLANFLFLRDYMERIIQLRSNRIKNALESNEWRKFINE